MSLDVIAVSPDDTRRWRELYRQEMNCQIIHDSWHERGWTDSYLMTLNGRVIGYGLVGGIRDNPRDTITEYYILPRFRGAALPLFQRFIELSGAKTIECQSNDILLTLMLYDCAQLIESHVVLFRDAFPTQLSAPHAVFRRASKSDDGKVFPHDVEPVGEYVIDVGGEIAATGGVLFHYNLPYGDIYMEVAEPYRRRGYGGYLVQELKRVCYEVGRIPAARCNASNVASRATLQRAGLMPCARILSGTIQPNGTTT